MTWTAEDILNYHLPENRESGTGGDYAKFRQFQQRVAQTVAERDAQIHELQRQVHDPENRKNVNHAVDLLTKAQETVDEIVAEADEYSRTMHTKARDYFEGLVADAEREAENIRQAIAAGQGHLDAKAAATNTGHVDTKTADAISLQLATTETLATILRGLVDKLEATHASLMQLRPHPAQPAPPPPAQDEPPPADAHEFIPWSEAAARAGTGQS